MLLSGTRFDGGLPVLIKYNIYPRILPSLLEDGIDIENLPSHIVETAVAYQYH